MIISPSRRQAVREEAQKAERMEILSKAIAAVVPGGTKKGKPIDLAKLSQQIASVLPSAYNIVPEEIQASLTEQGMDWSKPFAPGQPLPPFDGYGVTPRGWNYTSGRNISAQPRTDRIPFGTLTQIIEGYDVAQICIQHILNDITSFPIMFQPMEGCEDDVDAEIEAAKAFWRRPDKKRPFNRWLAMWFQDVLRHDAGTLFKQRDLAGNVTRLKVVDGTTILPLQAYDGERPDAPAPAYLQFIQGMPWDWLNENDMIYEPFTPLRGSPYGLPAIESVLLNANTDVRFQMHFLQYFTDGTLPEGIAEAPESLSSVDQIVELQEVWDAVMLGDQAKLRQWRWVPAGTKFQQLKSGDFNSSFPEYLMRRTVSAFCLTPSDLGFTEDVNRATADTQMDVQFRISTQSRTGYIENILDSVTQDDLGLRVQLRFDVGREKEDRLQEAQTHQVWINCGVESPDEARRDVLGLPVNNEEMIPRFILSERLGTIPLSHVVATSGEVDMLTGAPVPGTVEQVDFVAEGAQAPDPNAGKAKPENADGQVVEGAASSGLSKPLTEEGVAGDDDNTGLDDDDGLAKDTTIAAGLCVRAADSGRVLMLQRSTTDSDDPAAGKWEFPGGCIEAGEGPYTAATREWCEETGTELPDGTLICDWLSENGVYQGFVYEIPAESDLSINLTGEDRCVLNPDDPDGDCIEVVAWWDPDHLPENPALRDEVLATPWSLISSDAMEKAATVLRQWRDNSRSRVKNGLTPRRFTDPELSESLAKSVWDVLDGATSREEVDHAFTMLKGAPKALSEHERLNRAISKHYAPLLSPLLARLFPGAVQNAKNLLEYFAKDQPSDQDKLLGDQLKTQLVADPAVLVALADVLKDLYHNAYLAGIFAAVGQLGDRPGAQVTEPVGAALASIDWAAWQPLSEEAAADVVGSGLTDLLNEANAALWAVAQSQRDRMGEVLTLGLRDGLSVATIAHKISIAANGSNHAAVLATTEAAKAQTVGTFDIFRPAGITQFDWLAEATACPACLAQMAANPHPVGAIEPPLHPHCRCGTRAVIDTGTHVGTHALVGS